MNWKKGALIVAVGVVLMLVGVAGYEVSKQLLFITPGVRFVAFLALLGGIFGYSAQRVAKAIEYKPWAPKP
jgi:multisubunit Na+/H+ antiporter MnhG subunit